MKDSKDLFKHLYESLPKSPDKDSRIFKYRLYLIIDKEKNIEARFISESQYKNICNSSYCETIDYISRKNIIHDFYYLDNNKVIKISFEDAYKKLFKYFHKEYMVFIATLNYKLKVSPFVLVEMGDGSFNFSLDVNKNKDYCNYLEDIGLKGVNGYSIDRIFKKYLSNKGYYRNLSFDSDKDDFIMYINKNDLDIVIKDIIKILEIIKDKNNLSNLIK